MVGIDRDRLVFSEVMYWGWNLASALSLIASVWSGPILGHWDIFLGMVTLSVATRAQARLERLDGHRHSGNDVNVPR